MPRRGAKGETAVQVSAASFFANNQAIAGFDNPGKALFTSIRELVENSLDACEAVAQLPDIRITVEELSDADFGKIRGIGPAATPAATAGESAASGASGGSAAKPKKRARDDGADAAMRFFRITCSDNGCGMPHDQVPHMLGRVLSGSKYVVRQTRGKFGLGAKMALIWSKKSTGLPITVATAHAPTAAARARGPPARITRCVLDIDVHRNEPRVVSHVLEANEARQCGTKLSIVIGGAWAAYRRHVLRYMQQLAIITPYAELSFAYVSPSDSPTDRGFSYRWSRRALVMPQAAAEVRHHPASVNNLVVRRLVDLATGVEDEASARVPAHRAASAARARKPRATSATKRSRPASRAAKGSDDEDEDEDEDEGESDDSEAGEPFIASDAEPSDEEAYDEEEAGGAAPSGKASSGRSGSGKQVPLRVFLTKWFACVSRGAAKSIIGSLPPSLKLGEESPIAALGPKHIHALTVALASARLPSPSGACLSPVGEYNLRLGILKELRPDMLATFAAPASAFDGHPFVVEAGVALGGGAPDGLTVHRFANRIPLLFEGGGDVATLSAQRLAWKTYGIDPRADKIAVFVSIVSTKIPFKGTGKEYIGDDAEPIRRSVKAALQRCCQQLKVKLRRRQTAKDRASRAKSLTKYIPTVASAIHAVLKVAVEMDPAAAVPGAAEAAAPGAAAAAAATTGHRAAKRARLLPQVASGEVSAGVIAAKLEAAVMRSDALDAAAEAAEKQAATVAALSLGRKPGAAGGDASEARLLFACPLPASVREALVPTRVGAGAILALLPGARTEPGDVPDEGPTSEEEDEGEGDTEGCDADTQPNASDSEGAASSVGLRGGSNASGRRASSGRRGKRPPARDRGSSDSDAEGDSDGNDDDQSASDSSDDSDFE
ncbi:hypothetical protein FNF31_04436 [Cafeteria roenbergensis]|uniref:DNA topoisomerase VI subunit B transducer domain-containing protein n=1 Tax=Cafeteria roenbergensis TaxID=33653 RepID=A0A5A8D8N4_CAFRO|nr:hypothetical protein FNF31_04436 [Cafeteria roenbergensis]